MYHHHSQQEAPPPPVSDRPRPFHLQEQGHQQQQQHHSPFQYPPTKGSRDIDMAHMDMNMDMHSDRMNGSGSSGGYQERPQQPFSNRPGPFHQHEQGHHQQQQQQQQHSHFRYPPTKGSRDLDMPPLNMDVGKDSDRVNGSGSGGYQERPPQPFFDRPAPFHQQEQGLQQHQQQQQQQQQQHSHFQYPPMKSSRDLDMYSDRTNGSGPGGYYSSTPQRLSESQPGHQHVPLECAAPDRSDYQQHPGQTFSSPPSTATQQPQPPQSSHSAAGLQAWTHGPPPPPSRGSHSGDVDGQGVREKQAWTHEPPPPPSRGSHSGDVGVAQGVRESAGSILAGLGLSGRDLELLSQYPEDQLTPDKLPYLLQDMLGRRKPNEPNIAASSSSSSSSSYSQNATQRAARRETMPPPPPPPSSSQGSSGRRRSPEASGLCIEYGHSSLTTVFSSGSREAFIPRETLSGEGKSPCPPASSSLPKQEMDVTSQPERWQVGPQPTVSNNMHGDRGYHMSSGQVHRSKRSPEERPLPPRSGRPDPDYRRDGPNRRPSSETFDYGRSSLSTVLSSSGREAFIPREPLLSREIKMAYPPGPPASSSLPRQEMDVAPERWQFGAQPAVSNNMHGDQGYHMSSGEVHRSKRSPAEAEERPLPPRSGHPDLDYRREGPKPNTSPEAFDYGHSSLTTVLSSSRETFIPREPLSASSSLPKQETHERWQFGAQPSGAVSNSMHGYLGYHMSSGEVNKSKRSPVEAERPLPPRSGHPDPDYRRDGPKPSPTPETRSDQPSSSSRPAPWSSLSEPGDGTQRTPTPSTMCDLSESPKDWSDQVKKAKITEYFRELHNKAQLSLGQDDLPATRERSPSGAVSARRERTERERERLKPEECGKDPRPGPSSSSHGPERRRSRSPGHQSGSSSRQGPEGRTSNSSGHHSGPSSSSSTSHGPGRRTSNSTGHHSGSSSARRGPEKRRSRSPGHHSGSSSSRPGPEGRTSNSSGHHSGSSTTRRAPEKRRSRSPGHHKGSSSTSHGPEMRRSQSPGHHKGTASSTSHGPERSSNSPGLHKGTASSTRRAPESRTINCPGHHIIVSSSSSSTGHAPERRSSNSPELSSRDSMKRPRDSATRDDDSARRKPKESTDHGRESPAASSSDEEEDSVVQGSDCPVLVYPRWTTGRRALLPRKKKKIRGKKKAFVGGFLYSIV